MSSVKMSSISRLSLLSSRLTGKRYQLALPVRPALLFQPFFLRFNTNVARKIDSSNEFVDNVTGMNSQTGIKRILRELNNQVQRSGRVNLKSIQEAISQAQKTGFMRGVETQFLLRATGSFLKELDPSERDKLREEIWKLAKKDELDISHYNTLLHIKLENDTPFNPTEFLQQLSEANIAPNRVTYQRLVQRYCQLGDVQSATKIVEFMKSNGLAVSEKVFHSLITGYLRAGNPEKARGIIAIMESENLTPTAETYTVLAEGLAERGDITDAIDAVCKQKLMDHQILRIAKTVAMRDGFDVLEKVLSLTPEHGFRDFNIMNTCLELIVAKKLDAAIFIWQSLRQHLPNQNSGNFIPIQMMKSGYPIHDVVNVCERFKNDGMGDTLFIEVARNALYSGDLTKTKEYLKQLEAIGHPIRPHYFLPCFCLTSNEAEQLSGLRFMTEMGHQPLLEFLVDIILPKMDSSDAGSLLERLEQAGVNSSLAVSSLAIYLLLQKRVEDSEKLLTSRGGAVVNYRRLATTLGSAVNTENMTSAVNIISSLVDRCEADSLNLDLVGLFLEEAKDNTHAAIEALRHTRLPISPTSLNRLKAVGYDVEPLAGNVREFRAKTHTGRPHREMSKEELEGQISQLEGANLNAVLRRLLNHYCKDHDVSKVEDTLKKLSDSELNGANFACLTELYTNLEQLDTALEFYHKLNTCPDFHIDSYKVFALAEGLVKQKRWPEALAILNEQAEHIKSSLETFNIERNASRLLSAVYRHYTKEELFDTYDRFISPLVDTRVFGPLIRELCEADDSAAFDLFKEIAYKYRSCPYKKIVGKYLIRANRTEDLDTFISILNSTIGSFDSAMELALCYIECEKPTEAKEMLLRCEGRRGKANLIRACNAYINDKKFGKLEALLKLLEDIGIEKDVAAYYRIKLYNESNDVEKALEVWTRAQEENTVLFPVALDTLAKLLERNGQPVPFLVPERQSLYGNARFATSKFHDILDESLEKALEYRTQLKRENQQLNSRETSSLVHELINHDRLEDAFAVVKDMANFKSLDARQKTAISRLIGVAANKNLTERIEELYEQSGGIIGWEAVQRAYVNAGRVAEFLEKLEARPAENVRFYISHDLLTKDPAIGARFVQLSERLASESRLFSGVAQLWYMYIAHSETEKARTLCTKYAELEAYMEKFRIQPWVKESFDAAFFNRLLEATNNHFIRTKAFVCTLHELIRVGRIDEARECFNVAKENAIDTSSCSALIEKLGELNTLDTPLSIGGQVDSSQKVKVRSS